MEEFTNFWTSCLSVLEKEMPPYQFNTWICLLTANEQSEYWYIYAPTHFIFSLVKDNCLNRIKEIKGEIAPDAPSIELKVGKGDIKLADYIVNRIIKTNNQLTSTSEIKVRDGLSNSSLNFIPDKHQYHDLTKEKPKVNAGYEHTRLKTELTFENLVEGKSNKLAYNAGLAISENLGKKDYNPFFVYGSTGLGKTHLVQAIANRIFQQNTGVKVRYIHADKFINEFVKYVKRSDIDGFKKAFQGLDLLILDDVQFIAGKEKTMEEFFYLFNHLLDRDNQIILTSDRLPSEIEKLDKRLISRFSWGLTVEIEPPELEMRVAILQKKAESAHFKLPDEIAFFIAQAIKSNVRDLEGALNRVKAHCTFTNSALSIDLVKSALKDILAKGSRQITIEEIQKVVTDFYHIKISDIKGSKRTRKIVRPRQIAMSLSKELTENSLPFIGEAFGGKDHTTVIHACKAVSALRQEDIEIAQEYDVLLNILTH